jgi:glycosyltransferase involved in cell wall biosynthesis
MALLEATSQRICPVVSDAGGLKEAVRAEVDGIVVPRERADVLSQAIRRLHANRALIQQFAASAYQRVCDFFSPTQMAARTIQLYRKVLEDAE